MVHELYSSLLLIFSIHKFSNGVELNIGCSLVNCSDFRVTIELFDGEFFSETDASEPFDASRGGGGGDLEMRKNSTFLQISGEK